VRLNGRRLRDPEKAVVLGTDAIEVDGTPVRAAEKQYLMVNKPRGVVVSARDERDRRTVYSLISGYRQWLAPVGRLDRASEGLLLMTNDPAWGARISSPDSHLEKTYHVQVATVATQEMLDRMLAGVRTSDGALLRVKRARIVRVGRKNSWLEIVLEEGQNRHIRRLLSALGVEVLRLVRIAIGALKLGNLAKGSVRPLREEEQKVLARRSVPQREHRVDRHPFQARGLGLREVP
jgi:23S rRNA pseudouridine2605 synthase